MSDVEEDTFGTYPRGGEASCSTTIDHAHANHDA
jgi:hypothetical protein